MKNLTWQNPEQLFVAQELINKVKSKCCGIKDYIVLVSMFLLQVSLLRYLRRKAMDFMEIRKSVYHKWTWLMDNSEWGKARRRSIHKGFTEIERNVINDYYAVISSKFSPYSSKNYYSLSMKFSKIIILLIVYFAFVRLLRIIFGF